MKTEAQTETHNDVPDIAIVGAGPAGLMAAEAAMAAGARVRVFDAMPSAGRKFLLAGRGGLNLTHAEAWPRFLQRYGEGLPMLQAALDTFDASALRAWAESLGTPTFVGSSGRVFPTAMKAAPLLRAWLHRLREGGVAMHMRHRLVSVQRRDALWQLDFATPQGVHSAHAHAVVLALGGASWPRLGSDGAWVAWLRALGVPVSDLVPANCGFEAAWSLHFSSRFAGAALKNVCAWVDATATDDAAVAAVPARRGELMLTAYGVEGGLVYSLSAPLRDAINAHGSACLRLDLAPDIDLSSVTERLTAPRAGRTLAAVLERKLGLDAAKRSLLRECTPPDVMQHPAALAACIKALPVPLHAARPIAEAISSAGGVQAQALDQAFMLREQPGLFCAGEMLDWEAPTGGYLLNAAMATGRCAGEGAVRWARRRESDAHGATT